MTTIGRRIGAGLARLVPEGVRQSAFLRPRYPLVGIELREDAVLVARLAHARAHWRLAGHARRALDEGVFSASPLKTEVLDAPALARGVADALSLAGAQGAQRVSLTLPDTVARVFLVDVEELPAVADEAAEMIRFRIRKSIPFRPEDARLSWQPLGRAEDGRTQVLVTIAPNESIAPFERALESLGLRVGLVGLASFETVNALRRGRAPAGLAGDQAILNATPTYFSLSVFRGERLILYRAKTYHVSGRFSGEESLRVVGRELRSTVSYYEEHLLGEGIARTLVRAAGVPGDDLLETVAGAGCGETLVAGPDGVLADLRALAPDAALELLPAVGLALRRAA